jgi:hypothetical protein
MHRKTSKYAGRSKQARGLDPRLYRVDEIVISFQGYFPKGLWKPARKTTWNMDVDGYVAPRLLINIRSYVIDLNSPTIDPFILISYQLRLVSPIYFTIDEFC